MSWSAAGGTALATAAVTMPGDRSPERDTDARLAAIEAERFDTALTGMGDTPAREEKLDFVDYSTDGNAIVVKKGNALGIKTIADLGNWKFANWARSIVELAKLEE